MAATTSDLFSQPALVRLPERIAAQGRLDGNLVRQLEAPEGTAEVSWVPLPHTRGFRGTVGGFSFAAVDRDTTSLHDCNAVLRLKDASSLREVIRQLNSNEGRWIRPRPRALTALSTSQLADLSHEVLASWRDAFRFRIEEYEGTKLVTRGLRAPQAGAIYATKAHWSVSEAPATIVLPTGAGKTETMVSLLISERIPKLLVLVPSDALRTQISMKFLSLGVLRKNDCVDVRAIHPIVTVIKHAPKSKESIEQIFAMSQVVVATMQVVSALPRELQEKLAECASHLFVDEAHHIGAKTWRSFKSEFRQKPIIQFTATPYRNDGKRVDGKFIYVYPLRRAQADGLFKKINFVPVYGTNNADIDNKLINLVGQQLSSDEDNGHVHIAMARTNSITRAMQLHKSYSEAYPEHRPALVHSKTPPSEKRAILRRLQNAESRIVVCVNMLGEGYDLPELKIAALHDQHKSESTTLQFIGRFTRARPDLGDATVIANIPAEEIHSRLGALHAEDADWNHILAVAGHSLTERARKRENALLGFERDADDFPLDLIEPRLSTVVFETTCTHWAPSAAISAIGTKATLLEEPFVNDEMRLLVLIVRDEERLRWISKKDPKNIEFNLIMAHWDEERHLLFINTSRERDLHTKLAAAITNDSARLIEGEQVFRALYGFRRLMLINLGLSETQRKPVRFSMFMGSDIADQLNTLPGNRTRKINNLFGQGYVDVEEQDDDGEVIGSWPTKSNIGCSTRGKIWSYQTTNSFAEWIEWCRTIGRRLQNDAATNEVILRNVIRPERLTEPPKDKTLIADGWPESFDNHDESRVEIEFDDKRLPFFQCEISVAEHAIENNVRFRVRSDRFDCEFALSIDVEGARYSQISGPELTVVRGTKQRSLLEIFREDPPHFYFADGDMLVHSELFVVRRDVGAYDVEKIETLEWKGVDLRVESQTSEKRPDSIQRYVIERLLTFSPPYDIVFDDDGAGEAADIVAIRLRDSALDIDLYHCKYSAESKAGARVSDLYELCGQAQKSVRWAEQLDRFLQHLRHRENERLGRDAPSRFEKGDIPLLMKLLQRWRELKPCFSATIVQPGYSKSAATKAHLELFAATEAYLMETWRMPLRIWTSP